MLLVAAVPASCLREAPPPLNTQQRISITPLPLPPQVEIASLLGAFRLEGAWRIDSPNRHFGSYSAMVRLEDGQLLAISDRGTALRFSPPGTAPRPVWIGEMQFTSKRSRDRDAESATRDPASGRVWIATEGSNAISRHGTDLRVEARAWPLDMRDWSENGGAEAMVRLDDGRFIVLAEGFTGLFENHRHAALIFPGDPTGHGNAAHFAFFGPAGFSATDMAALPDGRVLVLMRRLVWPMPVRFTGLLAIADPAEIRPGGNWHGRGVARLASPLPIDNFEAMAIEPRADGKVSVWLMSDDNNAVSQRTLLWKLAVDPADLPGARKKAREPAARP